MSDYASAQALLATGSGQPQAQRFNQPISFVSSGTVGSDPMEIRPALQQVPSTSAPLMAAEAVVRFATPLAVPASTPAYDAARHWAASDAQLQQAAETMAASASPQAHTPGETCCIVSSAAFIVRPFACFGSTVPCLCARHAWSVQCCRAKGVACALHSTPCQARLPTVQALCCCRATRQ